MSMSSKCFTTTGNTPEESLANANDKADEFIKNEKETNKNIQEIERTQEGSILKTSNYYYCTVKVRYEDTNYGQDKKTTS